MTERGFFINLPQYYGRKTVAVHFLMPLFTDISGERVIRALQKCGFYISKNSGKHCGMTDGIRKVAIPRHPRLNPYTLKSIIRSAGLSDEQFKELL